MPTTRAPKQMAQITASIGKFGFNCLDAMMKSRAAARPSAPPAPCDRRSGLAAARLQRDHCLRCEPTDRSDASRRRGPRAPSNLGASRHPRPLRPQPLSSYVSPQESAMPPIRGRASRSGSRVPSSCRARPAKRRGTARPQGPRVGAAVARCAEARASGRKRNEHTSLG